MKDQIQTIKDIMGTGSGSKKISVNLSNYKPDEKMDAIYRWKRASCADFSTYFVDSVYDQYLQRGKISTKQEAAIDKIIVKFNICLDTWSL